MASFPTTLPLPLGSGYKVAPADQTIRTNMESGHARVRRLTYARNDAVTLNWLFTDIELNQFRDWFEHPDGAAGGAAWFTISIPIGTAGMRICVARFANPPSFQYVPHWYWTASAELEIR